MKNTTKNNAMRTAAIATLGLASLVAPMQNVNAQTNALPSAQVALEQKASSLINSPSFSNTIKNQYNGNRGFISCTEGVMQTDFNFNVGKVNVDFWSNYDFETGKINETDITLSYGFNLGKTSFNVSAAGYHSPNKWFKDCVELGISASRNLTSGENPLSINAYAAEMLGENTYEGQYYNLELRKSVPIVKGVANLDLSALVAYDNHYFGVNGSGVSQANLGATLDLNLGKGFHAKPFYSHQIAIEKMGGTFKDTDTYGVTVSKSF